MRNQPLLFNIRWLSLATPATLVAVLFVVLLPCSTYGQSPATGTIAIYGSTRTPAYARPVWWVSVNGVLAKMQPPAYSSYSAVQAAQALAYTINFGFVPGQSVQLSSYVTADVSGNVITLTTKGTGSAVNFPFSASVQNYCAGLFLFVGACSSYTVTTSGPTLTGGLDLVPGFLHPKYMIVGVTYAPPGAQSAVTYTNSTLVGSSVTINKSFTDNTSLSVQVSAGISAFGNGGGITGTFTTSYSQKSSSSSSISINKTTQVADKTSGPSNSFAGLDHDFDVIWLWLNPVLSLGFLGVNNPHALTWNGYGYDPNDQPGLDVLPVFVGWLNGDIPVPSNVAQVLARPWASQYIWGPGQGPGITGPGPGTDFANIVQADPFWQCKQAPGRCPTTPDLVRFTLSDNQNVVFQQAPVGGQPITQTYQLQYSNTSTQGRGTETTFSAGFGIEA